MSVQEIRAGLVEVEPFTVAGLSRVTDSERAADDINALWQAFFEKQIGRDLPGKADDVIYAVYSDYEGDHTKPYRVTIGYRVEEDAPDSPASPELHRIICQAGPYALLSAAGEQPRALIEAWEAVWAGDLERRFATDFEIYGPRFFQEGLNEVLLHIGLNAPGA
ncbi:MAG: GyrI-like domain-containing protein [Alphaproteobacteria bacterium]|nr:GyrI-like domain-containing protein [Alphaproteobacteria bacterium]